MSAPTVDRPVAPIDPRIRARRIEVRRGQGRRRLQRLVDLGLLVAVGAGFALALRSPLLDVDRVRVDGAERTDDQQVLAAAGVEAGQQLVDLDLRAVATRVADLPWVAEAEVARGLDGLVTIVVQERVPVAVVGTAGAAVLVDAGGRALGPVADQPDAASGLVLIEGLSDVPAPGAYLTDGDDALALATRLAAVAPGLVQRLTVGEDLRGVLASGIQVRFGEVGQLEAKVRSLDTVLRQVDLTCAAVIDVRVPDSAVLTREEGCS